MAPSLGMRAPTIAANGTSSAYSTTIGARARTIRARTRVARSFAAVTSSASDPCAAAFPGRDGRERGDGIGGPEHHVGDVVVLQVHRAQAHEEEEQHRGPAGPAQLGQPERKDGRYERVGDVQRGVGSEHVHPSRVHLVEEAGAEECIEPLRRRGPRPYSVTYQGGAAA